MSRTNARIRLLNLIRSRHALTIGEIAAETGRPRDLCASLLRELERDHLINYDPQTTFYRPQEPPMRIKKPKPPTARPERGAATVADLAAERDAIIISMNGPHALAVLAVEDDAVLHERLAIAMADGMPAVDLSSTPNHRRPAAVEEAVDAWLSSTRHGPCGFCGSRTLRRGTPGTRSYLDPDEVPGFVERHGQKACGACQELLDGHTLEEVRELVFNALAGCRGLSVWGEWRHRDANLLPFAHEVGFAGEAWAHLRTEERIGKIRARAHAVVHRSRFARTPEAARQASIPGIKAPYWEADALPGKERKVFAPILDLVAAAEDQIALKQRREAHEASKSSQSATQRNREKRAEDARIASEKALAKRIRESGLDIAALKRTGVLR